MALWSLAARRPSLVVALLAALLYLPWLSAAPVRGSLEANRLVAAREMLARGDWVLPTLNGQPYLAKPPFQYWLIEIVAALTGSSVLVAGRAISALAVVGLAALVAAYGRRTVSGTVGLIAGLGVALAGIVIEKGVIAELETVLAAAMAAAAFSFYLANVDARRRLLWISTGGLALGAAFLTKGPVVLVFLLPAAGAFVIASPGERRRASLLLIAQVSIGLALTLPWVIALLQRVGWNSAALKFQSEAVERVHHAGVSNAEPWWFYGPGLFGALGPLALLLPFLVLRPWRAESRRRRSFFLLGWALGSLLLLSCSEGKEVRYLISGMPAWALLLAEGAEAAWVDGKLLGYRRVLRGLALAVSWAGPVAVVGASFFLSGEPRNAALVAGGLLFLARILASLPRRSTLWVASASVLLAVIGVKVFWAHAYFGEARSRRPVMEVGSRIDAQVPADRELVVLEYDSVIELAADRRLHVVPDLSLVEPVASESTVALIASDAAAGPAWTETDSFQLGTRQYRLVRREPEARHARF
ncbi:MAG TPA: glycosyltransferase family 39 protein [Planctomycetota bacterium]|nr:glycosyltransferase family 39 protein [Planctomycetota bacterium]